MGSLPRRVNETTGAPLLSAPNKSKVLDLKSREKAAWPKYATGNFCPLSTASVKSNLDHRCLTLHPVKAQDQCH